MIVSAPVLLAGSSRLSWRQCALPGRLVILTALTVLDDGALRHQFVVGVRDEWVRHELRRLMLRSADMPFIVVRGGAVSDV